MATGLGGHHSIAKGNTILNALILGVIPEWQVHADYNLTALANTIPGAALHKAGLATVFHLLRCRVV
jgi:hypothetical protein